MNANGARMSAIEAVAGAHAREAIRLTVDALSVSEDPARSDSAMRETD